MSEFAFQKSQRVIVPADIAGAENVQAVIVANSVRLGYEPNYTLQFPSSDTVGEHGALMPIERVVGEAALVKAQPQKMVLADEAQNLADLAYRKGADDLREEIEQERASRLAKRKASRMPARKSRRK